MSEPIKKTATVHLTADDAGFECVAKVTREFRDIKCTLPVDEFNCLQWAAKRTFRDLPNGGRGCMPLADFFRAALLNQLRAVVREQIARGKAIPPDIAARVDRTRGE